MTKQAESTLTGELTPANSTICGQCKSESSPFLHYIKHRGLFRRLCTTCVLRFNSQSFCPSCFSLYNPTTPLQDSTTPCSKCYSISHSSCIEGLLGGSQVNNNPNKLNNKPNNPSIPYVCPLCNSPPVFRVTKNEVIDKKSAAALLAAARISYDSMCKAKAVARAEVDKRGKEAWSTKKRARDAIEHVASIQERLKVESRGVGFGGNLSRIVGNVGERNLFGDGVRVDRVDSSSAVLASLNAVKLNDKEQEQKSSKGNVLMGGGLMPAGENGGVSGIDEKPSAVLGPYVQNNHPRDGNGGSYQ
ncbi:hypothetical protein ACET3Z_001539 [Daucus carota]